LDLDQLDIVDDPRGLHDHVVDHVHLVDLDLDDEHHAAQEERHEDAAVRAAVTTASWSNEPQSVRFLAPRTGWTITRARGRGWGRAWRGASPRTPASRRAH